MIFVLIVRKCANSYLLTVLSEANGQNFYNNSQQLQLNTNKMTIFSICHFSSILLRGFFFLTMAYYIYTLTPPIQSIIIKHSRCGTAKVHIEDRVIAREKAEKKSEKWLTTELCFILVLPSLPFSHFHHSHYSDVAYSI